MLTREEMQALRAPFELSEHTVREGFRNAAKTKIRWFVYIDRSAIADRLDDMFLGDWGMAEPQIHIQDKKVSAVVGITIRGITRYDGGEDDSDEGTKGALTNAFRRTAAYGWGMARYLYDMDFDIWTDAYKSGDWDDMRSKRDEAFKKFQDWYNRQFKSVGNTTQKAPPPAQKPAQQPPQAQSTTEPQAEAKNPFFWFIEGKHPSWFLNPIRDCWQVAKAYIADPGHGIYKNDIEMKNSFIKRGLLVDNKLVETWGKLRAGEVIYCLFNRDAIDKAGIDWMTIKPEDMAHTISYHAALASEKTA